MSPLLTALFRNRPYLVQLLLEEGADLNFKSRCILVRDIENKLPDELVLIIEKFKKW